MIHLYKTCKDFSLILGNKGEKKKPLTCLPLCHSEYLLNISPASSHSTLCFMMWVLFQSLCLSYSTFHRCSAFVSLSVQNSFFLINSYSPTTLPLISEWVKSPSVFVSKDEHIGNENGLPSSPVGKLLFRLQTPAQVSPVQWSQSFQIPLVSLCVMSYSSLFYIP